MTLEEFIISHSEDDTSRLILGRDKWPDVDVPLAVNIIECRRKIRQKLPEWYAVPGLIYPDRICAEQSSSSFTANYKASVAGRILSSIAADGRRIADLTGGLGVDSLAFSAVADKVLYNEMEPSRASAARHNFPLLGAQDIVVTSHCVSAENDAVWAELKSFGPSLIYMDPARRSSSGSKVFLLDEDTSATNFMVRDAFMQHVISREKEPITPFLERARDLYEKEGISTILVAGSSGAFFHIADTVIQIDNYMPVDITAKVRELCRDYPLNENTAAGFKAPQSHRIMSKNTPLNGSKKDYYGHFKAQDKPERLKVKVHGRDGFSIGKQEVDLRYVEQLIDSEQTGALGALLKYAVEKLIDGKRTLPEIVELLCNKLEKEGLSFLSEGYTSCGYAVPRRQEIYACFNRYRRP